MSILFLIDTMLIRVMNAYMCCFENKEALEYKQNTLQINLKKSQTRTSLCKIIQNTDT